MKDFGFIDWASQVLTSLLLDGNSYCWKTFTSDGMLRELIPIADELVEVTPQTIRVRKRILSETERRRESRKARG